MGKSWKNSRPIIERFADAGAYLRDMYAWRKTQPGGFSYRQWAAAAGCTAPYLNMVLRGKRRLSSDEAPRVGRALGLRGPEVRFLVRLCEMASASNGKARSEALGKLSRRGEFRRNFKIGNAEAAYLQGWEVLAVHALSGTRGFRPDPQWIAGRLGPKVSARAAQAALDILIKLGVLAPDGSSQPSESVTAEGRGSLDAEIFRAYHLKGAELGVWAIENLDEGDRRFGSVTAAVNRSGLRRLLDAVDEKRRELAALLGELQTDDADTVVHLNLQAFPLTRVAANGHNEGGGK